MNNMISRGDAPCILTESVPGPKSVALHNRCTRYFFTTPEKTALVEKLAEVLPGDLNGYHGKTYGGVSLGHIRSTVYGPARMPGAHMVPRPDVYRPLWAKADGTIDTDRYIEFYADYLDKGTCGQVAGFVLEPIQGWGGSVMPPDDFFPKLRKLCDQQGILLMIDEAIGETEKEMGY